MRKFTPRNFFLVVNASVTTCFQHKIIFIAFLSILVTASGYAQTRSPEDKIDPAFRFVMAQSTPGGRQVPLQFSPAFKTTPTPVITAAGQPVEERYDCIVYTSDVAALRSAGVVVNSVL